MPFGQTDAKWHSKTIQPEIIVIYVDRTSDSSGVYTLLSPLLLPLCLLVLPTALPKWDNRHHFVEAFMTDMFVPPTIR